jgi:hypothetical protein
VAPFLSPTMPGSSGDKSGEKKSGESIKPLLPEKLSPSTPNSNGPSGDSIKKSNLSLSPIERNLNGAFNIKAESSLMLEAIV